jgi:hypothetical protein
MVNSFCEESMQVWPQAKVEGHGELVAPRRELLSLTGVFLVEWHLPLPSQRRVRTLHPLRLAVYNLYNAVANQERPDASQEKTRLLSAHAPSPTAWIGRNDAASRQPTPW